MNIGSPTQPIGLFDSGLGGLTVLKELQRTLPNAQYIYLGDNARFPYGTKSKETIVRYARECANFLLKQNVGVVIVACNTASAAALSILEEELKVPVIGTIAPAVRAALEATTSGKIGILGTNATIQSEVYQQSLKALLPTVEIVTQACPLFVPLVEAGMLSGEIVEKTVELYLKPLKEKSVDTIILACTHYPLLRDPIQRFVGDDVRVIECSGAIAQDLKALIGESNIRDQKSDNRYYVTDDVGKFNYLANTLLEGEQVSAVKIEQL